MAVTQHRGKWIIDATFPDGTRLRRVSPVQSERGARKYEVELLASASSTSTPCSDEVPEKREPTLGEFAPEFLTVYAAVNNKPSEVVGKECALRTHLLPFLGNLHLTEIGPKEIERYKADRLKSGLAAKTINNHLTILRKLLVTAEEWGHVDKVPRVRRLQVGPQKFDWLTSEESDRFLAAVEKHYTQWRALFWVALRTGIRRGEIFALAWDDVDLVTGNINVRHSVYRGVLGTPKNGRERTVPMTSRLKAVLREHQLATRLRSEYLFPAESGELTTHQDHVDRPLHGALKLAGLRRIRFHDIRHSFASQLVSAGRSLKEVQELLGHQSITMTMRYAHLAPERMKEAVEALENPKVEASRYDSGTPYRKK